MAARGLQGRTRGCDCGRRLAAGVIVVVAAIGLGSGHAVAQQSLKIDPSAEAEFLVGINDLRASKGLAPLEADGELTAIARSWARTMAEAGSISHNSAFAGDVNADWQKLGENVGSGPSVALLHEAFVRSSGHYRNLVDPAFTLVGIGVVQAPDGVMYTSHQFMQLRSTTTPPTPPRRTAPAPPQGPAAVGVEAHDIDDACPQVQVQRRSFADVEQTSAHARAIDCAGWLGIATGTEELMYAPAGTVTRGQVASFLARLIERAGRTLPASPPNGFADDSGSVHQVRINQLAAVGVAQGTRPLTFGADAAVTRAAMATFLARTFDLVSTHDLRSGGDYFDDDDESPHEAEIDRLSAIGLATGTGIGTYSPQLTLGRDQVATFLVRTLDALIDTGQAPSVSD